MRSAGLASSAHFVHFWQGGDLPSVQRCQLLLFGWLATVTKVKFSLCACTQLDLPASSPLQAESHLATARGVTSVEASLSGRLLFVAYSSIKCLVWDTLAGEVNFPVTGQNLTSNRLPTTKFLYKCTFPAMRMSTET